MTNENKQQDRLQEIDELLFECQRHGLSKVSVSYAQLKALRAENLARTLPEIERLRTEQTHNRKVIAQHEDHIFRLQTELTEARRQIDKARKQEPFAWGITDKNKAVSLTFSKGFADHWKKDHPSLKVYDFYTAPVPAQPAENDKFDECLRSLVRQVALLMDDCEEHEDGIITIDCDISQGFLRRIYDLLDALEDAGCDLMEPPTFAIPPQPAVPDELRARFNAICDAEDPRLITTLTLLCDVWEAYTGEPALLAASKDKPESIHPRGLVLTQDTERGNFRKKL